eukprot:1236637-Rhodomonas_salina.3
MAGQGVLVPGMRGCERGTARSASFASPGAPSPEETAKERERAHKWMRVGENAKRKEKRRN